MKPEREDVGGLSEWAIEALGFDALCQCGHKYGMHAGAPGTECCVLDCKCGTYRQTDSRSV